jgi:hypothetical protein
MKKIYAILIITFSLTTYAETNAEIRNAIQVVINSTVLPLDLGDGITTMTDMQTSTRGIVYTYSLALHQDSLPDLPTVSSTLYRTNLNQLCTNAAMNWYKTNTVEMSYIYYDQSDNLVTLFKISSKDC